MLSNEMSYHAALIPSGPHGHGYPGRHLLKPPEPQIWVKRWDWQWVPQQLPDGTTVNVAQAECTFLQGDTLLPAIPDWPRWKHSQVVLSNLPADEYWRLSFLPHHELPEVSCDCQCAPKVCGLECQWKPVWTRIETPRACRWISTVKPCECHDESHC